MSLVVPWGLEDSHDEAKSRFLQFYESAWKEWGRKKETLKVGIGRRETNEEDTNECRNKLINHRMKELVATW